MLEAVCPNGHRLQIPPEHAGMKLRCPACNAIFQLAGVPQNPGASGLGLQSAAAAPAPQLAAQAGAPQPHAPAAQQPAAQSYAAAEPPPARWAGSDPPPPPPPAPAPSPAGAAAAAPPPPQRFLPMRPIDLGGTVRTWGQIAMMIGLVLVLSARGCDGLALRNNARLHANLELAKNRLKDQEAEEKANYLRQLNNPKETAATQETARKKIEEITANYALQKTDLEIGDWQRLIVAARDADNENRTWAYWREMAFVAGSIVLSLGLIALIMYGLNAERYLAFGMLAIILFSLYIGGAAWFGSIIGTMSVPPR